MTRDTKQRREWMRKTFERSEIAIVTVCLTVARRSQTRLFSEALKAARDNDGRPRWVTTVKVPGIRAVRLKDGARVRAFRARRKIEVCLFGEVCFREKSPEVVPAFSSELRV